MNNQFNPQFMPPQDAELEQLKKEHDAARSRMTRGIVFTAVGFGLVIFAYVFLFAGLLAPFVIFALGSGPMLGIGIPFLITGIIRRSKINSKINALERARRVGGAQVTYTATPAYIPVETPAYTPTYTPTYDPAYTPTAAPMTEPAPQAAPAYQPEMPQAAPTYQPEMPQAAEFVPSTPASGVAELDWQKYAPLEAGVSYNPGKDYKFHRAEGFAGSLPQTFVNRTFPKCPLCCSADPYWTIAQHNQMSWKGNLYLFKCSRCESIISMSMPDVTTLGNGGGGVALNPSVGLANLMAKKSSGKEAGAVYAVIESVGNSGVTRECEGKEFKLEQVQEMFMR